MTEEKRVKGSTCWFDPAKGIGFITPDDGEADYFVHWTNIEMDGFKGLKQGQRVSFVIGANHRGPQAEYVRIEE